jgi:hypothetical protein
MSLTITLPAPLADYIESQRRKADDLTYKSAVAHVLRQVQSLRLAPKQQSKRLTVEVNTALLPAIEGNLSDRTRTALWAGLLYSTTDKVQDILSPFISKDELPAVLEQIHQIIAPLTGHEFFLEEKESI